MGDIASPFREGNRDDVKAEIPLGDPPVLEVTGSNLGDLTLFVRGDPELGRAKGARAVGLDLNKHDGAVFLGNDVDLTSCGTVIPADNMIPLVHEIRSRNCLTLLTKRLPVIFEWR
jgi:hypothetical protein